MWVFLGIGTFGDYLVIFFLLLFAYTIEGNKIGK
jgi:hypothetical protein